MFVILGIGIGNLFDFVCEGFKLVEGEFEEEEDKFMVIVIVGKFNVGKFSILNVFVGEECIIVSFVSGIIRDVIDMEFVDDNG